MAIVRANGVAAGGLPVGDTYVKVGGTWQQYPYPSASIAAPDDGGLFAWRDDDALCEAIEVFAKAGGKWHRVWARNLAPAALTAVLGLDATTATYLATVTWTPPAPTTDLASVQVEQVGGTTVTVAASAGTASVPVPDNATVQVRWRWVDSRNVPGPWTTGTVTTPPPPIGPGGSVLILNGGSAGSTLVGLWPLVPGIAGYDVQVSWPASGGFAALPWTDVLSFNSGTPEVVRGARRSGGLPVLVSTVAAGRVDVLTGLPVVMSVRARPSAPVGATAPAPWTVLGSATPFPQAPGSVVVSDVGTLTPRLTLSAGWLAPLTGATFVAQQRVNGGAWSADVAVVEGVNSMPAVVSGDVVEVRVKAVSNGQESAWAQSAPVTIVGLVAPTGLASTSTATDYDGVSLTWDAVVGATGYQVDTLNEAGTVLRTDAVAGTTTRITAGIAQNTRYQFRVRATAGAILGPTSAAIRWLVGRPLITQDEQRTGTRPWSQVVNVGRWGKDGFRGVTLPAGRVCTTVTPNISVTFSGLVAGTTTRRLWSVFNSADNTDLGSVASPWNVARAHNANTPQTTGFRLRGTGWSNDGSANEFVATGTLTFSGTETYTYTVTVTVQTQINSAPW